MADKKYFYLIGVFARINKVKKSLAAIKVTAVNEREIQLQHENSHNIVSKNRWEAFKIHMDKLTAEVESKYNEIQSKIHTRALDSVTYAKFEEKVKELIRISDERTRALNHLMTGN